MLHTRWITEVCRGLPLVTPNSRASSFIVSLIEMSSSQLTVEMPSEFSVQWHLLQITPPVFSKSLNARNRSFPPHIGQLW